MENVKVSKKFKFKTSASLIILFAILAVYTVSFLLPILWAVLTSFKDSQIYYIATWKENLSQMIGLNNLTVENFGKAYTKFSIPTHEKEVFLWEMLFNSVLYAGGCSLIATVVPCVMAYLVARYDYALGKVVYGIVLVAMAIPIVGSLPSEMKMVESLGLMDSVLGLYVLKANFLGIYFLVFYAQFKTIPRDYTEAAEIDGASEWMIMIRIVFPIAMGTISTVVLLNFIQFWNDYQIPMIYWESRPVLAYGMYYCVRRNSDGWEATPVKLASMIIVAIPIIILFLIFNKKIMSNMSIGGVKG